MRRVSDRLTTLSTTMVWLAGGLLILPAVFVSVEVVVRKVFVVSVGGAAEYSEYVLAICSSWAFGFTLLRRAHIRIDSLHHKLGDRAKAVLDVAAYAAITMLAALLVWHGSGVLGFAWEHGVRSNTPLRTPMWIPQGLWFFGLVVFLLICATLLAELVLKLLRGDIAGAVALARPMDAADEVEDIMQSEIVDKDTRK